jgi:hypothetical protein
VLTLPEYVMREPLPLATIHEAILDFCRGRTDVCVFGAQALARHTGVPRMTQDVDIMAEDPAGVAAELARRLSTIFPHEMAARVRTVRRGERVLGHRVYQLRSDERGGSRHLADVRILDVPREALEVVEGIQFTGPELTLAMKTFAATVRADPVKRAQDRVDVMRLVRALPDVTATDLEPLWTAMGAPPSVRSTFEDLQGETATATATDGDDFY